MKTPAPDVSTPQARAQFLKDLAHAEGFEVARIADPRPEWAASARLEHYLAEGWHGDMDWMQNTAQRRSHPSKLWPDARSALMVGMNYGPPENPLDAPPPSDCGNISVYARGGDYHEVIKKRLKAIARAFVAALGEEVKVFVDTAPLMEKPLAERAGLGWQGKHTNLVSRDVGSWLFLGSMLTTAPLPADPTEPDHCGDCRACLDICPTQAFPAPYQLDARRCISYLTIEHKGPIPLELRSSMGNHIYGCDDCLAVCPWNKFARTAQNAKFHHRAETIAPPLAALSELDDAAFRAYFSQSPIKRTGRERFIRNVMIAMGNSGQPELAPYCQARLTDASPLVRGASIWALARLDLECFTQAYARYAEHETDPDIRAEWTQAAASPEAMAAAATR